MDSFKLLFNVVLIHFFLHEMRIQVDEFLADLADDKDPFARLASYFDERNE